MASTAQATGRTERRPWWQTGAWIGLIILGAFNLFAVAADLAADSSTGLPSDHTGTFGRLTGSTWTTFKSAHSGAANFITTLERGYALHELVFTILFLIIVLVPFRARQPWAWWACWALLIGYLGYTFTFGVHDSTMLGRSLIGVIALPVFLLLAAPGFALLRRPAAA